MSYLHQPDSRWCEDDLCPKMSFHANLWHRHRIFLFLGFTSCQMMSSWKFCPRPKILRLYNHTCANALRTLYRFVLGGCFFTIPHILLRLKHACGNMRLRLLLVFSSSFSQIYRSHICTPERERRWSCSCQCGLQETWRTGSGMSRNLWRLHWGITLTALSKSTLRSVFLSLTLFCFDISSTLVLLCLYNFKASELVYALLTPQQPRAEWVLSWPGQVVIAGCQVFWTTEVSEALEQGDLANRLYPQLQTQVYI